jgi:hypothetical protein
MSIFFTGSVLEQGQNLDLTTSGRVRKFTSTLYIMFNAT